MKCRINDMQKYKDAFAQNPLTNKKLIPLLDKAEFVLKDGLFDHHATFCYIENGCLFYLEFFANAYKKRRINVEGVCKYLNALMVNPETGEIFSRYSYEETGLLRAA